MAAAPPASGAAVPHRPAASGAAPATAAAGATYDLLANRARFHVHDAGLLVPFGGEGFRIYDLALRDSWGAAEPDGTRRLRGKPRLLLPWRGGAAVLTVRGVGKGQVTVDGKRRPLALSRPARGLGVATLALGTLAEGEHEVILEARGRLALASLELAAPGATGCAGTAGTAGTAGEPVVGAGALGGARELEIVLELPAQATLAFTARGGGEAVVALRDPAGHRSVLWQGRGDGRPRRLALAPAAGAPPGSPSGAAPSGAQLAALSFESPGCDVQWAELRLAEPGSTTTPRPVRQARHVVLVVVDTLRADRVAAITPTRVQTPRLSAALARGGLAFARNLATAPSSPPSHATIQTGLLPRVHGVAGDVAPLRPGSPVLSALLSARGFYTGYVGDNDFAMGRLTKPARWSEHHTPVFEGQGVDCAPLVSRALEMMAGALAQRQRVFLSLLPIDPHVPYLFHDGFTERYLAGPYPPPLGKRVTSAHLSTVRAHGLPAAGWNQLRALYDGEVAYFDSCFGALEDGLTKLGVAADTAIVVTSDHGEGMGERGNNIGHAYSLNYELTWVPLLMFGGVFSAPARAGALEPPPRWTSATSNLDIAPTILELLGEPVDPRMQGQSLLPLLRGGREWPRAVAAEYGRAYAIFAGRWHYVADYEGRGKLYDVIEDPAETRDRGAEAPIALRYLREAAAVFLSQRTTWRGRYGSWTQFSAGGPLAAPAEAP